MSNSKLVSYTRISPNSTNPRQNKIDTITIHHMACNGTLEGVGNGFADPDRDGSSNYGIDSNGKVAMYVEEKNRSWCSSSSKNDHRAITIEVANDGGAPDWHVSDKALEKTIELCVDICKRNKISKLNFTGDASGNLTQHNYFVATACPGPYLKSKFQYIADEVNKKLGVKEPTNTLKPIDEVAKEVIRGDWGNGAERKEALTKAGYDYNEVQAEVERQLNKDQAAAPQKPTLKPVEEVAKEVILGQWGNGNVRKENLTKAGYDYNEVQAEVDRQLNSKNTNTNTNNLKSIDEVAKEVIRGDWGNGAERKKRLEQAGYDYSEVQNRVEQLL